MVGAWSETSRLPDDNDLRAYRGAAVPNRVSMTNQKKSVHFRRLEGKRTDRIHKNKCQDQQQNSHVAKRGEVRNQIVMAAGNLGS